VSLLLAKRCYFRFKPDIITWQSLRNSKNLAHANNEDLKKQDDSAHFFWHWWYRTQPANIHSGHLFRLKLEFTSMISVTNYILSTTTYSDVITNDQM
jgi:hypothetical protein